MLPRNNMPPAGLTAPDLWAQITQMPRPHRVVDFPRKGPDGEAVGQLAIVPLTQTESMAATASTERFVRKVLKDENALPAAGERSEGYTTLFENRACLEILFRGCKKADDVAKAFFPSVEAIAAALTVDEIGVLFNAYNIVRGEIGPIVAMMSQEEMEAWFERLALGGAADPLSFLTLAARSDLLMYLVSQLRASRMGSSSPIEPPDARG